jgi:hypothetical protein
MTSQQLRLIFIEMGFRGVVVTVNTRGQTPFAFVTFLSQEDATRALEANGCTFIKNGDSFQLTVSTVREKPQFRGGEAAYADPIPAASGGGAVGGRWGNHHSQSSQTPQSQLQQPALMREELRHSVSAMDPIATKLNASFSTPEPLRSDPRSEPRREPVPQKYRPSSLFSRLRQIGSNVGISYPTLIDYLKWLTSQPENREIAENPTSADIDKFAKQMLNEISPGAIKFRNIGENGISPETVGLSDFKIFKIKGFANKYWVFEDCPDIQSVQKACCRNVGMGQGAGRGYCAFMCGGIIGDDGKVTFFDQPTEPTSRPLRLNPRGCRVVVMIRMVGLMKERITGEESEIDWSNMRDANTAYDKTGFDVITHGKPSFQDDEIVMTLPVSASTQLYVNAKIHEELLMYSKANGGYITDCTENMKTIGGREVQFIDSDLHQEPEAPVSFHSTSSDQSGEAALFERCYHGNRVKHFDTYTPCQSCMLHHGKGAISDGWEVVGYRNAP